MNERAARTRFRYRLTRLGVHFLFIALFAMMGGSLRGFNLLLVLAGLLVGILLIQWRIGRVNIRGARLQRLPLTGSHAGSELTLRYKITNQNRFLPLWMVRIHDQVTAPDQSDAFQEPDSELSTRTPPTDVISSVGHVGQSLASRTAAVCCFHDRGCYRVGPLHLSSSFPFSLVQSDQLPDLGADSIYVYPRLLNLRKGWRSLLPPRRGGDGHRSTGGVQQDGDFFGLRRWQSGDQVKQIHWRTTARVGEPLVRQFEQRNQHQICILVDGRSVSHQEAFERALEWTATILKELFEQNQRVALLVADRDADSQVLPALSREPGRATGRDLNPLLKRLAIASGETRLVDVPDGLADTVLAAKATFRHNDLVIVSTRPMREAIPEPADHLAHGVLRQLKRTGRLAWIDVNDPAVKRCIQTRTYRDLPRDSRNSRPEDTVKQPAFADGTEGLSYAGR